MCGEQLGKCLQLHDITTCTSVNLAFQGSMLMWSNLSRHLHCCKHFSCSIYSNIRNVYTVGVTVRWCLQKSCNTHLIRVVVISSNFTNFLGFSPFSMVGMSPVQCSFMTALALGLPVSQFSTSLALVFPCWEDDQPGAWDFVQCPHECTLSAWGFFPW